MALDVLNACHKNADMIHYGKEQEVTQDLLLRPIEIFFNQTTLEIAVEANALDFICSSRAQDLLTDIWYERINPDVANWKVKI